MTKIQFVDNNGKQIIMNIDIKKYIKDYLPPKSFLRKNTVSNMSIKRVLHGIIVGDIVGAPYEGNCIWDKIARNREDIDREIYKKVDLLTDRHQFTDDSVMSIAIYVATKNIKEKKMTDAEAFLEYVKQMRMLAKKYPDAGYGWHFTHWAVYDEDEYEKYKSYGDGSAMRSGVVGAMFASVKDVIKYAVLSAYPTHSHPDGIKGAVVTAVLVWMALNGATKDTMKRYVYSQYPVIEEEGKIANAVYPQLDIDDITDNPKYMTFSLHCSTAVPEAFINFICSDSYEECLRNCLRYPSDADTVMAISGGFAEAYYKDDNMQGRTLRDIVTQYLDDYLLSLVND